MTSNSVPVMTLNDIQASTMNDDIYDTMSEYRFGTPAPLRPLPLDTEAPDPKSPNCQAYLEIKVQINRALYYAGISDYALSLYKRVVPDDEATEKDHTILIQTTKQEGWTEAMINIHRLIAENELNLGLEIIDDRAEYFEPDMDDALSMAWPHLKKRVIHALGSGQEWCTLNLLNQGLTKEESRPTVTIGVTKAADAQWQKNVSKQIRDILQPYPNSQMAFIRSSLLATQSDSMPCSAAAASTLSPLSVSSTEEREEVSVGGPEIAL